jgi:hypothetical protein
MDSIWELCRLVLRHVAALDETQIGDQVYTPYVRTIVTRVSDRYDAGNRQSMCLTRKSRLFGHSEKLYHRHLEPGHRYEAVYFSNSILRSKEGIQ